MASLAELLGGRRRGRKKASSRRSKSAPRRKSTRRKSVRRKSTRKSKSSVKKTRLKNLAKARKAKKQYAKMGKKKGRGLIGSGYGMGIVGAGYEPLPEELAYYENLAMQGGAKKYRTKGPIELEGIGSDSEEDVIDEEYLDELDKFERSREKLDEKQEKLNKEIEKNEMRGDKILALIGDESYVPRKKLSTKQYVKQQLKKKKLLSQNPMIREAQRQRQAMLA